MTLHSSLDRRPLDRVAPSRAGGSPAADAGYPYLAPFPVSVSDHDRHGHLRSTAYYAAMEAVIDDWILRVAGVDVYEGPVLAPCVASSCQFLQPVSSPDEIGVGLRAARVGRTSITWLTGVIRLSDGVEVANGRFVQVFVDRETRRPKPLLPNLRVAASRVIE